MTVRTHTMWTKESALTTTRIIAGAVFALGIASVAIYCWQELGKVGRRALTQEWRSGYLAGYRTGSTQERYEAYEGSD